MRRLAWLMAPARWLERAKGRKRLALIALYLILAVPLLAALRWSTCLIGLPDIGEPYDVPAFRKITIPEAEDAFVLYDRAAGEVTNASMKGSSEDPSRAVKLGWSKAGPAVRGWVDENRDKALVTWRQATQRPNAMADPPGEDRHHYAFLDRRSWFSRMALLEASRLVEAGDMAGAWGWYLAAYRSGCHITMRGAPHFLPMGVGIRAAATAEARRWASDPRVDVALLRKALVDARACEPLVPDDGYMLREAYLDVRKSIDGELREYAERDHSAPGAEWYWHVPIPGIGEVGLLPEWSRRTLGREGERRHRLAQLAFARWVALADAGRLDERPAIRLKPSHGRSYADFFDMPGAAMAPQDLARCCASSIVACELLADTWRTFADGRRLERARRGEMAVMLAAQLYLRERGSLPPSIEALVGPYLDRSPPSLPTIEPVEIPTVEVPAAGGR